MRNILILTILVFVFCTSPQKQKRKEIKLYTDLEIEAIYEKFLHKKYQTDHQTSPRMKRFQL